MEEFHKDESGYDAWLDQHPDGKVLNLGTDGMNHSKVHRASCSSLKKSTRRRTYIYGKACAETTAELRQWANKHRHQVKDCQSCKPPPE